MMGQGEIEGRNDPYPPRRPLRRIFGARTRRPEGIYVYTRRSAPVYNIIVYLRRRILLAPRRYNYINKYLILWNNANVPISIKYRQRRR